MLTREDLLRLAEPRNIRREPVPGVDGLFVRLMTGEEAEAYDTRAETLKEEKAGGVRIVAALVVRTVCNADGDLLFNTDDESSAIKLPINVLESIAITAARVNKIDEKAVEELEKN